MQQVLHWFNENLERPTRFCRSAKPRRQPKGVCWFRSEAGEHLRRIWELIAICENNDVPIYMIKTERPGYVFYEDAVQVVAEPFVDLKRQEWR